MSLQALMQSLSPAIEAELIAVLDAEHDKSRYIEMVAYHMGWDDGLDRVAGKRTRPLLVTLAAIAAGGDWHAALPFAAAVELIHNFSLVHDDIQDNSPLRRGRPAVWTKWGAPQAINTGDALFAYAFQAIQRTCDTLPPDTCVRAYALLGNTCIALTRGQERDMDFETRSQVTVDEYLSMIEGKTASLIATATGLGALAAGASPAQQDSFQAFGYHLGMAFQLRDDILGIWGDASKTGKSAATDIETRKKTYPVLHALARDTELQGLYTTEAGASCTTAELVARIEATGALTETEAAEKHHTNQALRSLDAAVADENEGYLALRELTLALLGRNS